MSGKTMPTNRLPQPRRVNENIPPEKVEVTLATEKPLRWLAQQYSVAFLKGTRDLHPLAIDIRDQLLEAIGTDPNAHDAGIVFRAWGCGPRANPTSPPPKVAIGSRWAAEPRPRSRIRVEPLTPWSAGP